MSTISLVHASQTYDFENKSALIVTLQLGETAGARLQTQKTPFRHENGAVWLVMGGCRQK